MPFVKWKDGSYCKLYEIEEYIRENNKDDDYEIVYYDSEKELIDNYDEIEV